VLCSKCGIENPPGQKFCGDCGAPLANLCPKCGADNPAGQRFCGECGGALGASSPSAKQSVDSSIRVSETRNSENLEGERKTVTALFADIKGSTELEQDLDPEEARAIVDPALKLMIDAVHRYDGYVVQSTGDGIFAIFGAPVAHEDHPQRSLYAALRMQDEIRRYADKLRTEGRAPLQIRVGVNTGEVVVRSIATGEGKSEYTPIGHTSNLAARMQALANPGSTVISEPTRKLVEGYFALKSLGASRVKGIAEPVNVYDVTGLGPLRTRLQRSAGRGLTKFVGREREIETLKHAAEQAMTGHGQIVAAMAEPGVGKSRLYYEFKARNQSGWMVLEAFSVSHGKASAYLPVLDLLHTYFDIKSEDDARKRREKVAGKIAILDRSLEDTLPYLFALLGIVEAEDPIAQMDANFRKRRTLDAIKRILLRESLNQPLILIFEDLHWIDEQTQEFLNLLADSIANAKLLLLVNYRPEYSHQWGSKTYYTQLRLDPLGKESADEMLSALLGDSPSLAPLKRVILERTEGNPFFMEETYRALLDDGALVRDGSAVRLNKPIKDVKIPPTVQAILASRIDRLPADDKELLQTLSVVGREFPMSLIRAVVARSVEELDRMLNDLQLAELIYEQPAVGDTEYSFKHALTRDVAYNSVLHERRKLMHERVAAALENLYADSIEDHVASLAHHYTQSANAVKAVEYCTRACRQSSDRASISEALKFFEAGIARLRELPDDDRRAELELDLRNTAHVALVTLKGYGSPEGERSAERALELSRHPSVPWQKSWMTLTAIWLTALVRDQSTAVKLAAQLLALAEQHRNDERIALSLYFLAFSQMLAGEFELADAQFDRAASIFETLPKTTTDFVWQVNTNHALCYSTRAWNTWFLGFPERTLKLVDKAFALARSFKSRAIDEAVQNFSVFVLFLLGERERTRAQAETLLTLATELGNSFRCAIAELHLAWCDSIEGDRSKSVSRMQRALADFRATGSSTVEEIFLLLIAQVQCLTGHYDEAFSTIDEALAVVEQTGEHAFEAEIHRVKGEIQLAKGTSNPMHAERSLRRAIEIARRQKARSWELRATTSLARLLRNTDRREEARAMLSDIYNWFTEGFDTADLKDAKALLDELAGAAE
jgi:predicted ATPase/class 3 adenylate cyclase